MAHVLDQRPILGADRCSSRRHGTWDRRSAREGPPALLEHLGEFFIAGESSSWPWNGDGVGTDATGVTVVACEVAGAVAEVKLVRVAAATS